MTERLKLIGRPRKVIDLVVVEELAALGVSKSGIAAKLRFDRGLFDDRADVALAYHRGRAELEVEVCGRMLAKVRAGDLIATIFAAKAICGWRDSGPAESAQQELANVVVHLPENQR